MMSTCLKTPKTLGTLSKLREHDLDLVSCPQRAYATVTLLVCLCIVMYAEVMRIGRGTTEVFLPIMPWTQDDNYVSQDAKHSRHACEAIGALRRSDVLSTTSTYDLRSQLFVKLHYLRGGDNILQGYNRRILTDINMDKG